MVDQAEIHRKAASSEVEERIDAVEQLSSGFADFPDKKEAWYDLHRLTQDEDIYVRWGAADALGSAFPYSPNKEQAWKDLHLLTLDEDRGVQWRATDALGSAFPYSPNKEQAWKDLHILTLDEDGYVRRRATDALGSAFPHIPDKEQAWHDLHRLTVDKNSYVRRGAAYSFGSAFPHIPNKEQAWKDLIRLTEDKNGDVRISANHSLGRASVFKAVETENEVDFRKKLKGAIEFFERSSEGATHSNPSRFCLLFYRLFYTLLFEKTGAEDKVQKYLADAKNASEGSEDKAILLEAVGNLANALTEKVQKVDFGTIKSDLNTYRQYCERAADLIGATEEKMPGAAQILRRRMLITDQKIKKLLEEVNKKSENICRTVDLPESELSCNIEGHVATALATDNPVNIDRQINHILSDLEMWSRSISDENEREYVQKIIFNAEKEDLVDKLLAINSLMSRVLTFSKDGEEMSKYEIKNSVVNIAEGDRISQSIQSSTDSQKGLSQNNAEAHELSEEPKESTIPSSSDLESEICDIFKSVYQKEREENISEVNSKTLEFLKYKFLDLTTSDKEINWLDVECGDGRCLDVLAAIRRDRIRYHGIDSSYRYFDDAEKRARKYKLNARLDKIDAAAMKFDSEYDVVSAVLSLHKVDPLCLPYVLWNMLRAIKDDGILIISDFQGPYKQESGVIAWNADDIICLLENISGAGISVEFKLSEQYPEKFGFYRCYIKKPHLSREKFNEFLQGYGNFMEVKKEESKRKRWELRSQIEERVRKLLNRSDIDLKNISEGEMQRIRTGIGDEYGIKAHKIRLLTSQIEFLDDKIKEFKSGSGCDGRKIVHKPAVNNSCHYVLMSVILMTLIYTYSKNLILIATSFLTLANSIILSSCFVT